MMVVKDESKIVKKRDLVGILVLTAIALTIGVYLIFTTVLISNDGVFYIERAKQLTIDPVRIITKHPPGFPFLILIAYKFTSLFSNSKSVQVWIYSAQAVTLLCRLLALIPLYFIGKLSVGGKNSFWAVLILIFLPFPTKVVCDVVREWPYLLFLASGFFFLFWCAKYGKWYAMFLVGLSSGLGYLIRHESAQLIVYGILWLASSVLRPKRWDVSRWKSLAALALLLIGFAIPAVPYMKCTGRILPPKTYHIMQSVSFDSLTDKTDVSAADSAESRYYTAKIAPDYILKALNGIFKTTGENLMWFFLPMLLIGFWYHLRLNAEYEERFLITAFITMNVIMMVLRYSYIQPHISQRWSLPLITFTVFYIPIGFGVFAKGLENIFSINKQKSAGLKDNRTLWFWVLLLTGLCICSPKLLRPIRMEKKGYLDAAKWLRTNTAPNDTIALQDRRIAFYAMRKGLGYSKKVPKRAKYVVRIAAGEDETPEWSATFREKYSVWVDKRKEKKRIVIYKVL